LNLLGKRVQENLFLEECVMNDYVNDRELTQDEIAQVMLLLAKNAPFSAYLAYHENDYKPIFLNKGYILP
jgi:hypothetical protein